MKIIDVSASNLKILFNLAQAYEAEFSIITKKNPDPNGVYLLDTNIDTEHLGYLFYDNSTPIGFCIKGISYGRHDIAEFYIIPTYRNNNLGEKMAIEIFKKFPGPWQVRQISGADKAKAFWRKTIKRFTNNNFIESQIPDKHWGQVTCQMFEF
ncbi:MAG: hypothetical protein KBD76_07285 [Bacteriovorax sp.]|jgi:predicted acetyltransferase|nr:hypothetical protein [Bacteriovorax sp.]